jgi:hypothetical protein
VYVGFYSLQVIYRPSFNMDSTPQTILHSTTPRVSMIGALRPLVQPQVGPPGGELWEAWRERSQALLLFPSFLPHHQHRSSIQKLDVHQGPASKS